MDDSEAVRLTETLRQAVLMHESPHGATQWYVDERCIDCDADQFWAVVRETLKGYEAR